MQNGRRNLGLPAWWLGNSPGYDDFLHWVKRGRLYNSRMSRAGRTVELVGKKTYIDPAA